MKVLVGAFNQEKALVGAFSVIVQPVVEPIDSFTALVSSSQLISSCYPIFVVLASPARCGRVVNDIKLVTVSNVFIFVSVVSTNISL